MADLFWFSDQQWARVEPLLPKNTRGLKRVDDRRVLSGIVACHEVGLPVVRLPERIRAIENNLQSLCEMGRKRHLGRHLRSACRRGW